jgi:hypothetical protein
MGQATRLLRRGDINAIHTGYADGGPGFSYDQFADPSLLRNIERH